jgi:hypothetical protein
MSKKRYVNVIDYYELQKAFNEECRQNKELNSELVKLRKTLAEYWDKILHLRSMLMRDYRKRKSGEEGKVQVPEL